MAIRELQVRSDGWGCEESAALLRLARVLARAAETFEDFDLGFAWLNSPVAAFKGATSMSSRDKEFGVEFVMDVLGPVEHGVFPLCI
ncbi:antitoxin Xre/MbcA/ParS toxin-binding domain-containing protein [Caballeronia concitans]|uniref:Antitoxin n=1 Tax=Caballeronia concitans TaxID=1777133 RepID=A0A658R3L1_9BURK|nr:antitoxin Xre/MbcA/ParS toxin-binding domain-containing protein [Caballeronia concitans]SAL44159.1 antitoxin [Caballeronia concitans]